jgi:hypothetical protein
MALVRVGDDLFDDETGEYAGPADSTLPDVLETEEHLIVWMRRLMLAESAVAARKKELAAVIANCEALVSKAQARVDWLMHKHSTQATAIAESLYPRKSDGTYRSKTYQSPWGKVSSRTIKGGLAISDPAKALEWCMDNAPQAIKVSESVLVSKLPEWNSETMEIPNGFEYRHPRESVTFTTIGKERMDEDEA